MYKTTSLCLTILVLLIENVISASFVPSPQSLNNQLLTAPHGSRSSDPLSFSDVSTQSKAINVSKLNALQVRCNGKRFGTPLDLESCRTVISDVVSFDKEESFGMRYNQGSTTYGCGLPYRWLSRMRFYSTILYQLRALSFYSQPR